MVDHTPNQRRHYRITAHFKRLLTGRRGFTLFEVLVAGLVLVIGLIAISQFFSAAAARVLDSDIRSMMHQVATEDLEYIRGLPYEDVGTVTGHPTGVLAEEEARTIQNINLVIQREVIYWTDPSYSGPYPANYRRVTVTVSAADHQRLAPVELTSNVAGGTPGGSLDITVTDLQGSPVPDARIEVTNDHLIPHVNISSLAIKTDASGHMLIPGLTPDDTPSYYVEVSKTGYNSDWTDPMVVVQDGLPYTVLHFTIDRLANMRVRVVDTMGAPVGGLTVSVVGPDEFDETIEPSVDGYLFSNIRYSTDLDPYIVRLVEGQGYEPVSEGVVLEPGETRDVVLTVPAGGPTTTLPPSTTTTIAPTTTTTVPGATGDLTVRVRESGSGRGVRRALVTLDDGQTMLTNRNGYAYFSNLELRTYSIVVARNNYYPWSGSVLIDSSTSVDVFLLHY